MVLDKKTLSLFEITLIVLSGIAFSYITAQTNPLIEQLPINSKESKFISLIREKALNYLSGGIVSAQSLTTQTCLIDKNGAYCQEYPSESCNSECTSSCFPGKRSDFSQCQLGTCYDTDLGLCNAGTPKATCENNGGTWYAQTPVQCTRGCCLVGPDGSGGAQQAKFTTQQECTYLSQQNGFPTVWDGQVNNEFQCLSKVRTQQEGACVLNFIDEEQKYNCEFTSQIKCLNKGGEFYSGQLCTNTQLNTICERTENTQCFEDKDGVYFVDSCGNRANIYDSSKLNNAQYWNSVVSLEQSCSLDASGQQKCGNCNYIEGSVCGKPQNGLDSSAIYGQYVCKDLSCIDQDGVKHDHGESWCAFDSQIGLDGSDGTNQERAVDLPGTKHYRLSCNEGVIKVDNNCAEFRNSICVEQDVKPDFTNAQCRVNNGALCTSYNEDKDKLAQCETNPDCYLKHVEIDKFTFDVCAPKYPPGFELGTDKAQPDSEAICSAATQTCTYYEKKGLDGRWSCKVNCACKSAEFAETMNNFCMSLGDCGTKSNLAGEIGNGYSINGDKFSKVSDSYLNGLKKYITPKAGQRVESLTEDQIKALTGLDFTLDPDILNAKIAQMGLGAGALAGVQSGAILAPSTFAVEGLAGAANAALVGAGIGYIVGLAFGLEGDKLTTAIIVGAVAAIALNYFTSILTTTVTVGGVSGPIGWIVAIVVAIVVAILSIAGVGKYRERKVTFSCLPWQPPAGGDDCSKCSELGVECTAYKCASLGKTCELLNPQTENEACVNVNPNDVTSPDITFNSTSLPEGFTFSESDNGVEIKSSASDGSIQEYSPVTFGIITSEPAQCKISSERPDSFEDMEENFFDSSLNYYVTSHTDNRAMETLDSLGVSGVDPTSRGDYNLYVMCEDKSGNHNDIGYNIRFKISPADDHTVPVITKFVPDSPGVAGLTSTQFNLAFFTNEPATCRFSTQDVEYELMEGEVNCNNDLTQSILNGWICNAQLPISQDLNQYNIRCADQPWLGENIEQNSVTLEEGRNKNTESRKYEVKKTTTPLTITSISPQGGTILSATEPVSVTLQVTTSGGIDNGKAFCKFSFDGNQYIDFATSSLTNHKQIFTSLFGGNYNIRINCNDRAGNIAEGSSEFSIETDTMGPLITRLYSTGQTMSVITNEASICEYSLSTCNFEFETGTALSGASKSHTMTYENGKNYRIKCRDTFGNVGQCISATGGY
jgi:hypothetical protein